MKRFAAGLTALCIAGWAAAASAQTDEGRSGPYIGAGATFAIENFDNKAGGGFDNSWGYDIKAGYRFNPFFALEAEWQHFTGFDGAGDPDLWMIGANAKGFILPGPVQPYVLAGLGYAGSDEPNGANSNSETAFGARFGAGIDFYASRNFVIYAEAGYVLPFGELDHFGAIPITLGLQWRFF
ncbi:MAG TPA: porin family protein [Candidatus Limnocylindrales bacterium]|nr:porin family protein [Candidatus Limnocylindrales bacterium]